MLHQVEPYTSQHRRLESRSDLDGRTYLSIGLGLGAGGIGKGCFVQPAVFALLCSTAHVMVMPKLSHMTAHTVLLLLAPGKK